ncbi:MAG: type II toxin-antitoxin system VapC family toxin [Acidobacteria bacterium]|nr:type II toxin-antitoxin system VapC family toxin [Acidobacteriota bacterium]
MIHLDTTFAVDLLREVRRRQPGAATAMRGRLEREPLRISVHVACELLAGAELSRQRTEERQRVLRFCDAVDIAYPDAQFAPAYGRLLALQQRTGRTVGTRDLLIATAAILDEAPLLTRNKREFSRIPDLEIIGY